MLKQAKYIIISSILLSLCCNVMCCSTNKESTTKSYVLDNNDIKESNKIIFLGDSITANCNFNELYKESNDTLINMGIIGDSTYNVLNRLDDVVNAKPNKVFLLIGINDILGDYINIDKSLSNYEKIITTINSKSKDTKLYIESVIPINEEKYKGKNKDIENYNIKLQEYCKKYNLEYIDIYSSFFNNGIINIKAYSNDGLHLTKDGYNIIKSIQKNYIEKADN